MSGLHEVETVFTEGHVEMLDWSGGPVLADQDEKGVLLTGPDGTVHRIDDEADVTIFAGDEAAFLSVHRDGTTLRVVQRPLRGDPVTWEAPLTGAAARGWAPFDALPGRPVGGTRGVALVVETDTGAQAILEAFPGGTGRIHPNRWPGESPVHVDGGLNLAVTQLHDAPDRPVLHVWPLDPDLDDPVERRVEGRWLDVRDGLALVERDGRPVTWRPGTDVVTDELRIEGDLVDARFLGSGTDTIAVVVTSEGADSLVVVDRASGARRAVPLPPGRIRVCSAHAGGVGLRLTSVVNGGVWAWLAPDGTTRTAPGGVPPLGGGAVSSHRWQGATPIHVHLPGGRPTGVVISLHGGPEIVERDELRFDGLYRRLLERGIAVLAVNYAGSSGYGAAHTRRAWRAWEETLREDLTACLTFAERKGVPRDRTILLGASFGGGLALLGNAILPGTAGVVACSPLVDLVRHVRRMVEEDPRCRAWFTRRFGDLTAEGAVAPLDPVRLACPGGGPVFLIQGDRDPISSLGDVRDLARLAAERGLPWELVVEPGVGHRPATLRQALNRYRNLMEALEKLAGQWGHSAGTEFLVGPADAT
ncbi:alpha/beta hydrolase family protein [Streptosporangium sp. NPDC049376]|uniref:alpha/beta hydrolase family protein n=1 Tax=Streptosporangium sp. NPDC049376 TaxID=3366192 RepID=UPI0037A0BF99